MTLSSIIWTVVKILIVVGFIVNLSAILTWMERRQSAMMQDRVGPNRAEITVFGYKIRLFGLLYPIADAVKMFTKEDFIPPNADKVLHSLAPMLSLFPPLVVLGVVPFTDTLCLDNLHEVVQKNGVVASNWHFFSSWIEQPSCSLPGAKNFIDGCCVIGCQTAGVVHQPWAEHFGTCPANVAPGMIGAIHMQVIDFNPGVLYVFALAGMGIVGASIAGWSSDNKFSLMGGLRAASQLVSYEVAMGLSIVGAIMVYGTIRLDEMTRWQGDHVWGVFVQPLAFILFLTAAIAETKRAPFDLPEGESEIVAGYLVEYSGMKFGMFYMGEFIEIATSSALLVAIFLGGYNMPFLHRDGITIAVGDAVVWKQHIPHILVILMQAGAFFGKIFVLCWFQMFVRWTLPRFRYDQLMKLGWRMLLPAALANIFLTGVILIAFDRTGTEFQERMGVVGDFVNLATAIAITFVQLWIVIGFFGSTQPAIRRNAFNKRARSAGEIVEKALAS